MSMQCERVKNEEKVAVHARKKPKTSDTSKQKEGVLFMVETKGTKASLGSQGICCLLL